MHVWRASDDFTVIKEIQTQYGTIYAMAVTKAYLIVGQQLTVLLEYIYFVHLSSGVLIIKCFSAGTFNQNIQIMDVQSHNHIRTLTGHIGTVTCLCTTPCGQFMFSASVDTTVQVSNAFSSLFISNVYIIGMEFRENVANPDTTKTREGNLCISIVA